MNTIDITIQVPMQRVYDIVVNAFDNNSSGYWLDVKSYHLPKDFDVRAIEWLSPDDRESAAQCRDIYFSLLVVGGWLDVKVPDCKPVKRRVSVEFVERGLALMAKVCPTQFAALMSEDDDVWTADALMQCIVLHDEVSKQGELIFG
mgnify:CR=1 FL=1